MKTLNKRTIALLTAAFGVVAITRCSPTSASPPTPPPVSTVKLVEPRPAQVAPREEVTGTLFPEKSLQVGFEVAGRLKAVKVRKGDRVVEGQLLGQLDPEISDAQVAQAEAALVAAEATSGMANDVAHRNERLLEQGSISDLQSKNASTSSRQTRAQVLVAKAALAQARAVRKRHELRAPFAGTVINAPEEIGATVGPAVPLFTIEALDTLVLRTTIPESARIAIKPGAKVTVSAVAGKASTDNGSVRVVILSADAASRRIPVEVTLPNADSRFVAHSLARAVLPTGETQRAQALPSTALSSNGGDHVFVLPPSGEAKRVPVEVLERNAKEVIVRAEIPLERVIDYPAPELVEGTKVSVR